MSGEHGGLHSMLDFSRHFVLIQYIDASKGTKAIARTLELINK